MNLTLNWFEIPTEDFNRAKIFYETLFNYEMQVLINEVSFKMGLFPGEQRAPGAIVWHPGFYKSSSTEGVLIYFDGNPDLSNILNRVEASGGKVIIPKRQISPEFGFMAVFTDSEGNRLALHSNT
jgi:predicted enzyme related to lactoylglutathione lyase